MNEVKQILVSKIDTKSAVNVRRLGIDDNVELVKSSIQEHGYWPDQPIVIRPHPEPASGYEFQHITGQCRLKACLELELSEIPAVVVKDISDEDAIRRSWGENEHRTDLLMSDKAYWAEYFYKHYAGNGHTIKEALELAAKFLNVTLPTVQNYLGLAILPREVMRLVDSNLITKDEGTAIVKNTHDASRPDESQQNMIERASWLQQQPSKEGRRFAVEALNELKHNATIEQLNQNVKEKFEEIKLKVDVVIPAKSYDDFLKWGEGFGVEDKSIIINLMIAEALKGG